MKISTTGREGGREGQPTNRRLQDPGWGGCHIDFPRPTNVKITPQDSDVKPESHGICRQAGRKRGCSILPLPLSNSPPLTKHNSRKPCVQLFLLNCEGVKGIQVLMFPYISAFSISQDHILYTTWSKKCNETCLSIDPVALC